jgi:hypothetical protein
MKRVTLLDSCDRAAEMLLDCAIGLPVKLKKAVVKTECFLAENNRKSFNL